MLTGPHEEHHRKKSVGSPSPEEHVTKDEPEEEACNETRKISAGEVGTL
jgi:hypothetical protein